MWPGGPRLSLDSDAQTGRRRSWIRRRLGGTRAARLPRGRAELRLLAAHANRKIGRAFTAALAIPHEALDDPVLEGVEADHGKPAAGPQHREGGRQRGLERA